MIDRQKQAVCRGYQARLDDKRITENFYSNMGKNYQVLAGFFEKGWLQADEKIKKSTTN